MSSTAEQPEAVFIHQQNTRFHSSNEVEFVVGYLRAGGEKIPNEPSAKIAAYLGFLANKCYVNDGILTGDADSIERQVTAHSIGEEDIPESYLDLQRQIAREQGHGDIEVTDDMRREAQRIIAADQKQSLAPWAEYLSGDDAGYPDWFKLYAFANVLKMGKFDKEKSEFQKRSKFTTVPFPELSRGALSQVYSWLKKAKIDGEETSGNFTDERTERNFQKALQGGSFAKLYVHAIHTTQEGMITPEQQQEIEGSWRKYLQNSDPHQLHGDLQGFGLDWCTSTGYETAKKHIEGGDFYVYYTRDEDGSDTVPRIAIRMENGRVAEVRGIGTGQELEPEMVEIAQQCLPELSGGENYMQKAEDMKRLTAIEKKLNVEPSAQLTREEVGCLYEIERRVEGFGYDRDPRIAELQAKRDMRGDLVYYFDCRPDQISLTPDEALQGGVVYHRGDLYLRGLTSAEGLQLPETMNGDLYLSGLTSAEGLQLPETMNGFLNLSGLTSAERNRLKSEYPHLRSNILPRH